MDTPTKCCSKCGKDKPATREFFRIHHDDCLRPICKQCQAAPKRSPEIPDGFKRCTKCGNIHPATLEFFYRNGNGKYGLLSKCRNCIAKTERRRLQRTNDTKECSGCHEVKRFEKYPRNKFSKDGLNHYCLDCKRNKARASYKRNHQHCIDHAAHYRSQHPDKVKRAKKVAYQKKPWVYRESSWRRRARTLGAYGEFNQSDIDRQYKAQNGRCYWCEKHVRAIYHVDHVIPLSRSGSNDPSNLVIACPRCNLSKGDKLPHEWKGNNGKLL